MNLLSCDFLNNLKNKAPRIISELMKLTDGDYWFYNRLTSVQDCIAQYTDRLNHQAALYFCNLALGHIRKFLPHIECKNDRYYSTHP